MVWLLKISKRATKSSVNNLQIIHGIKGIGEKEWLFKQKSLKSSSFMIREKYFWLKAMEHIEAGGLYRGTSINLFSAFCLRF